MELTYLAFCNFLGINTAYYKTRNAGTRNSGTWNTGRTAEHPGTVVEQLKTTRNTNVTPVEHAE